MRPQHRAALVRPGPRSLAWLEDTLCCPEARSACCMWPPHARKTTWFSACSEAAGLRNRPRLSLNVTLPKLPRRCVRNWPSRPTPRGSRKPLQRMNPWMRPAQRRPKRVGFPNGFGASIRRPRRPCTAAGGHPMTGLLHSHCCLRPRARSLGGMCRSWRKSSRSSPPTDRLSE